MLKQEPLPTHDGRRGNRGSVVNIASQLGIVGRPAARTYPSLSLIYFTCIPRAQADLLSRLLWFKGSGDQHDKM